MKTRLEFRSFNSKLLLFGEYTVLEGSSAVACPFEKFQAKFRFGNENNFLGLYQDFYRYMKVLDLSPWKTAFREDDFEEACVHGMYFDPEIPVGYGIGSSGAFTAAVYDAFMEPVFQSDLKSLQSLFALVESYFHGRSSGFDPLVSYINNAILNDGKGHLKAVELPQDYFHPYQIYLIDSGHARSTSTYVEIFRAKMQDREFSKKYLSRLITINEELISSYINNELDLGIIQKLTELSYIQLKAFPEMILPEIAEIWREVHASGKHLIKLCGAGGGGFYYLFSADIEDFKSLFPEISPVGVFK